RRAAAKQGDGGAPARGPSAPAGGAGEAGGASGDPGLGGGQAAVGEQGEPVAFGDELHQGVEAGEQPAGRGRPGGSLRDGRQRRAQPATPSRGPEEGPANLWTTPPDAETPPSPLPLERLRGVVPRLASGDLEPAA